MLDQIFVLWLIVLYGRQLCRGRFCLSLLISVVTEITLLFLNKLLIVPKKPAHCVNWVAGKCMVYEGQVWVVYWMSVVIGIAILFFNRHLMFITKPAPTRPTFT